MCDTGPCDFTITSDAGARYRFEYDPAVKDWTGRDRQVNDCVNEDGTVALKRAYVVRSQITLTPTRAVKKSNGTFITEMFGDRRDKNVLTDAGRDEGCPEAAPVQVSVRAVRADPPAGQVKADRRRWLRRVATWRCRSAGSPMCSRGALTTW